MYQRFLTCWQRPTPKDISGYFACLYHVCSYRLQARIKVSEQKLSSHNSAILTRAIYNNVWLVFLRGIHPSVLCPESVPQAHMLRTNTKCKDSENDGLLSQP